MINVLVPSSVSPPRDKRVVHVPCEDQVPEASSAVYEEEFLCFVLLRWWVANTYSNVTHVILPSLMWPISSQLSHCPQQGHAPCVPAALPTKGSFPPPQALRSPYPAMAVEWSPKIKCLRFLGPCLLSFHPPKAVFSKLCADLCVFVGLGEDIATAAFLGFHLSQSII